MRPVAVFASMVGIVSIRARHCWRAMHSLRIKACQLAKVSIRARHCWRAMRRGASRTSPHDCGFNPRPPLLAGDAPHGRRSARPHAVSIRARHCWRAMHQQDDRSPRWSRFNPRPPLLAGDARAPAPRASRAKCFNPRPPLLAGDAAAATKYAEWLEVSIRARHCWRAMPSLRQWLQHAYEVSIRARHCWRAMRQPASPPHPTTTFQSAPAIAGGRCGNCLIAMQWGAVSIRARHCWRAMPCQ